MVDAKFIIKLQGKDFITHEGLLSEFHNNGGKEIETELLNTEGCVIFKAKVSGTNGSFIGHGDADDSNVNSMIAKHKIRMAETRAVNRALRLYNNIGMCSIDELKDKTDLIPNTELEKKVPIPMVCNNCTKPISEAEKSYSIKFFNRTLCLGCQKKPKMGGEKSGK